MYCLTKAYPKNSIRSFEIPVLPLSLVVNVESKDSNLRIKKMKIKMKNPHKFVGSPVYEGKQDLSQVNSTQFRSRFIQSLHQIQTNPFPIFSA